MPRAIVAYSFDEDNVDLIKLKDIASYDAATTTWLWELLYLGEVKSTNVTSSWNLDFGDIAGLVTGPYIIRLTVTVAAETDIVTISVAYDTTAGTIITFQPIFDQVTTILGSTSITSQEYLQLRDKWQNMLYLAFDIPVISIHDESLWPPMVNTLIAYLIVKDSIVLGANRELASISTGSGGVKRVETGPVNTEWFDTGSIFKSVFSDDGFWDQLLNTICGLASQLGVHIQGCKGNDGGFPPIVLPKSGDWSYQEQYIIAPQFQLKL